MGLPQLKVVEPALPPERENLLAAMVAAGRALETYQATAQNADKLRGLIAAETAAKAALARLEEGSAAAAAAWARGRSASLELTPDDEIAAAKATLAKATRLADAARGALLEIEAEVKAAAPAYQQAVISFVKAVHAALNDEADLIRAEQLRCEQRAADLVEELIALGEALKANPIPNDGSFGSYATYRQRIRGWITPDRDRAEPRSLTPRPELATKFIRFAERLARDPTATIDESKQ
jgi:hypothetical protein